MSFVQNDPPALHLQDGATGGFYCATLHRIILSGPDRRNAQPTMVAVQVPRRSRRDRACWRPGVFRAEHNLMVVTALNQYVGYNKAAKLAKTAHQKGISLRDANRELGFLTEEEFDRYLRPEKIITPA
jgi:hypothetical protein